MRMTLVALLPIGLLAVACGSDSEISSSSSTAVEVDQVITGSSVEVSPSSTKPPVNGEPASPIAPADQGAQVPSRVVSRNSVPSVVYIGEVEQAATTLWERSVVSPSDRSTRHGVTADANDEFVVAGTGEGTVVAIESATGEVLWSLDLTGNSSLPEYNSYAMYPTIAGNSVFIAASTGVVYSVDVESGMVIWESPVGGLFGGHPAVVGDTVVVARSIADLYDDSVDYAGDGDRFRGGVVAVDASTGQVLWERASALWATAVGGPDGTVVIGTLDGQYVANGAVESLDAATGHVMWVVDDVDVGTPPAVGSDLVVVAASDLIALDGQGVELWRTSRDWCGCTFQFPAIVDDTAVIVTNEAGVYGLDVASGHTCWQTVLGDSYAIAYPGTDGLAAIADGGAAAWIDAETGRMSAKLSVPAQAMSIIPTTHGPIVSSGDGFVRLIEQPVADTAPAEERCTG